MNPSAAEIAKLKKAGFNIAEVPPAVFGKKKSHVDKVLMLPFYYGAHLGLEVPEAEMYAILKTVEKNADALAKANKAFRQIAQDMPKMQRRGVESAVGLVEIHPGLAKYMRENGVWDSKWDARIGKAK